MNYAAIDSTETTGPADTTDEAPPPERKTQMANNDITNSIITQADAYRDMTAEDALAELCPRGDAVEGIEVDQDWDNETTTIAFQDGSRLVISGSDVEVAS